MSIDQFCSTPYLIHFVVPFLHGSFAQYYTKEFSHILLSYTHVPYVIIGLIIVPLEDNLLSKELRYSSQVS